MDVKKNRGETMASGRMQIDGRWPIGRKVWVSALAWVTLLAGASMLPQSAPQAQSAPTPPQFCYPAGGQQCYDSQAKAEAVLRAEPLATGRVVQWRRGEALLTSSVYGRRQFLYSIPDHPAEPLYSPSYLIAQRDGWQGSLPPCAVTSDSYFPGWCADEDGIVGSMMGGYRGWRPECSFSNASALNDWEPVYDFVSGFTTATNGRHGEVGYGRKVYETTMTCPGNNGGPSTNTVLQFVLRKRASFSCPADSIGRNDSSNSGYGDGKDDIQLPNLCRNTRKRYIDGPMLQVASCPANGNPCYPATGNKARFETDFEFAGRSFTRTYHSLNQLSAGQGMAPGWTHSFLERIDGPTSGLPTLVSASGYYETFVAIGNGRYRAENSPDRILEQVNNAFPLFLRLREPDGEIREFDAAGRLIALRRPDDPLRDMSFTYINAQSATQGVLAAVGWLATATDAQGRQLRFEYGQNGLLSRIVKPDGSEVKYGYDNNDNLVSVDYGLGRIKQYHYAESGLIGDASQRHHLTGITAESGIRYASFRYDAQGRAVESRVLGSPNEVTTVSFDSDTQGAVTTPNGLQRTYTFQSGLYRRITGISEAGSSLSQQYDATGRIVQSTDKRGVITQYEYTAGHRSATIEAVGTPQQRRLEVDRDPVTQRVLEMRTKDAGSVLVARSVYAYNARGQSTTVTIHDPAAGATRTTTTLYCEQADVTAGSCPFVGLVKSVDGPRSDVADTTSIIYRQSDHPDCAAAPTACAYRKGDLWKIANALGQTTEVLTYDGAGRVKSLKDPHGIVSNFEYDARGWLTARITLGADDFWDFDDVITRTEYTAEGLVRKLVKPDRSIVLFGYDDGQRLTTVADSDGNAIVYTLNAAGERIAEHTFDATGNLTRELSREFDTLGRLARIVDANNAATVFAYDAEGNQVGSTDPLLRANGSAYDPLGRMTASIGNATAPAGASDRAQILYSYDTLDRLTRVTDPKNLYTDYAYNAFGERTRLDSPDTGVTTYGYDAAGNQVTSTDARGVTTQVAYDALNRPTTIDYPSDPTQSVGFIYDTAQSDCAAGERYLTGRLARMTDASGSTTWCYDRYGQLTQKLQRTDNRAYALRYLWTPPPVPQGQDYRIIPRPGRGRFYGWRYPDGAEVRVSQDREGRVFQIDVIMADGRKQRLLTQARYHPFGTIAGWTYGNGLVHRRTVDRNHRPGIIQTGTEVGNNLVPNPSSLSVGYQFDAAGNLTALRKGDQADPPMRTYDYDGLDRLTAVREGGNGLLLQGYAYDATGNRMSKTEGSTTTAYAYAGTSHRLTAVGSQNRSYDAVGNTTRIGGVAQTALQRQASARPTSPLWRQSPSDGQAELRQLAGDMRNASTRVPPRVDTQAGADPYAQWQPPGTARAGMRARLRDLRARREERQERSRAFWQWRQPEQGASTPSAVPSGSAPPPSKMVARPAWGSGITGKAVSAGIVRDFSYNAANRMSEVRHNGTTSMQYRYNGNGEQVLKFNSTKRIVTVYDESGRWIGDYDSVTGNPTQQAIWLGNMPVGILVGSGASQKLYYLQTDMLETPRVALDPVTSRAVWHWELMDEAFGNGVPNQDPDDNGEQFVLDMRFPGQRNDSSSGFIQNYYRDYDADVGRYTQSDPVGLFGGVSTYLYSAANGLNRRDRFGLLSECGSKCAPGAPRFDNSRDAAINILKKMRPVSMRRNIEFCGNICQDENKKFFWTGPVVGIIDRCDPKIGDVFGGSGNCPSCAKRWAAWHTHPNSSRPEWYLPDAWFGYDSEHFSKDDKGYGDAEKVNVYLGTPNGDLRNYLWKIRGQQYSPGALL